MDVANHEVSAAIDDAADDFAIGVYDRILERVTAPETVWTHGLSA
jgi:hypothetical protein